MDRSHKLGISLHRQAPQLQASSMGLAIHLIGGANRMFFLEWAHSSRLACHPGSRRILGLVLQRFCWPTLVPNVSGFVIACTVCSQKKTRRQAQAGLLQPLPVPHHPWSHISLNFVTGLPPSDGNTTIVTMVDRFSKAAHFIPLPKSPSAKETAQLMVSLLYPWTSS
jgi:hypothetical protein